MRCKNCKDKFEQTKFNVKFCLVKEECIKAWNNERIEKSNKQRSKAWRVKKKAMKESVLTVQDYIKIVQKTFNAYIRARDKGKPCISCGKGLAEKFDAGHYASAGGHWSVRFDEDNVHGQHSRPCNKDLHGDLINYRIGLVKRIGIDRVEIIEAKKNETRKFTIDELKQINEEYKRKIKEL